MKMIIMIIINFKNCKHKPKLSKLYETNIKHTVSSNFPCLFPRPINLVSESISKGHRVDMMVF